MRRSQALQSGAVGSGERIPGVAFSGSVDGHIRAY
jgi:hypothetical protein